ncbi:MAG: phosphoribosylformylglycinamidine synthase subunit PurQ [Bacteroidetes bacterium]|nr:phosphoribosylformylglycinamidine synthase subunit PurQ [Bacteroidota bacterium]
MLAGHDRSDGGLITTLLEMAFAGNCGIDVDFAGVRPIDALPFLFNEELGLVMECLPDNEMQVIEVFNRRGIECLSIGRTIREKQLEVAIGGEALFQEDMRAWREVWEQTSYQIDRLQSNPACVDEERRASFDRPGPTYRVASAPRPLADNPRETERGLKIAVIREEGSNGDREMASAFFAAGFDVWDVTMTDLLEKRIELNRDNFRGAVFVGGFAHKDVFDAAKGWAGSIRFNRGLRDQFQVFYERPDTFSLGVCNGCQLMALLGWVPGFGLPDEKQPRFIRNQSGRFESRFLAVKVLDSPAMMLKGMAGSLLGIWTAHGEGRFYCPEKTVMEQVFARDLAPLRFVDDIGEPTETYPFNPNGSPFGVAALCSPDGRHLAMMPHPERAFLNWQWGYLPEGWEKAAPSPWLRMFQNARDWCESEP